MPRAPRLPLWTRSVTHSRKSGKSGGNSCRAQRKTRPPLLLKNDLMRGGITLPIFRAPGDFEQVLSKVNWTILVLYPLPHLPFWAEQGEGSHSRMVCEEEYELLEQIGRGSYGKVYRAQHDSGEVHAIKVNFQHRRTW